MGTTDADDGLDEGTLDTLRRELIAEAGRQGWAAAGITGVEPFEEARVRGLRAIEDGRMAGMEWYTPQRVEAASTLGSRYPWARSLLALAWPYAPASPPPDARAGHPRGRVSAYACLPQPGAAVDYHELLGERCQSLVRWLRDRRPAMRSKPFIDHGWAMDRAVAERAGIGFTGKNACLITPAAGSYVMLAELLLSLPLRADPPSRKGCGSCRACIPSCPTGAIRAPGVIDATRCISYLTIEHRGPIAETLRPLMGSWVFGCDLCQEACPINSRRAPASLAQNDMEVSRGPVPFPDLLDLLRLDEEGFRERFRHTAMGRTGRGGLRRNVAIALGNSGDPVALAPLREVARVDDDEVVREAAGWAVARLEAGRADAGSAADLRH